MCSDGWVELLEFLWYPVFSSVPTSFSFGSQYPRFPAVLCWRFLPSRFSDHCGPQYVAATGCSFCWKKIMQGSGERGGHGSTRSVRTSRFSGSMSTVATYSSRGLQNSTFFSTALFIELKLKLQIELSIHVPLFRVILYIHFTSSVGSTSFGTPLLSSVVEGQIGISHLQRTKSLSKDS